MFSKYAPAALLALTFGFTSCDKDKDSTPTLRAKIDSATLTATSNYVDSFKDASGQSTVSLGMGNIPLGMFVEFNDYMGRVALQTSPSALDLSKLRAMYTGSGFANAALNNTSVQLRTATAASQTGPNAEAVRTYIDGYLTQLADLSNSVNQTAEQGKRGRLGRFLVDEKGYEVNQIIQKAMLGAVQLDQVGNVLLSERNLNADNTQTLSGKNYSELEHNWDMAYATLTANPVMITVFDANNREKLLAGYVNEKNPVGSVPMYVAFLKGRAAIVNNDKAAVKANADVIRTELEKTIALSAVSYLEAWKSKPTDPEKAHALAEGLGFIYSLRFCTKNGADAAFSNNLLTGDIGLMKPSNGFWGLTTTTADAAIAAIKAKFKIQ